jgi:chromosome segregation ATPase
MGAGSDMESDSNRGPGSLLESENAGLEVLERLERHVGRLVEELREARHGWSAEKGRAAELERLIGEKDRQIEQLLATGEERESERRDVRRRIESLLERVESLEQ